MFDNMMDNFKTCVGKHGFLLVVLGSQWLSLVILYILKKLLLSLKEESYVTKNS